MPNEEQDNDNSTNENIGGRAEEIDENNKGDKEKNRPDDKTSNDKEDNLQDEPVHSADFWQNKSLDKTLAVGNIKPGAKKEMTVDINLPKTAVKIAGTMPIEKVEEEEERKKETKEEPSNLAMTPDMPSATDRETASEPTKPEVEQKKRKQQATREPKEKRAEAKSEPEISKEAMGAETLEAGQATPEPTEKAPEAETKTEQAEEEPEPKTEETTGEKAETQEYAKPTEQNNVIDFAKKKQEIDKPKPTEPAEIGQPVKIIDPAQRRRAKEQADKKKPDHDIKTKKESAKKTETAQRQKEEPAKKRTVGDKREKPAPPTTGTPEKQPNQERPADRKQEPEKQENAQAPQLENEQAKKHAQAKMQADQYKKRAGRRQPASAPRTGNRFVDYLLRKGDEKLQEIDNKIEKNKERIKKIDKLIRTTTAAERGLEGTTTVIGLPIVTTPSAEIVKFFLRSGKAVLKIKNGILHIEKIDAFRRIIRGRKKAEEMEKKEQQAQQTA